jgi:hypothetical protein
MNFLRIHLSFFLGLAALAQLGVAILNLWLIPIMKWQTDLRRMPLLIREVFRIHCVFISITLSIFAVLTWQFANDIASGANQLAIWLAFAIGAFWLIRSAMQWLYYNPSHWRGNFARTVIHWLLFLGYGALATVYFTAAVGGAV